MGKCLVSKLNASVNNTDLSFLDCILFTVNEVSTPTSSTQRIEVVCDADISAEVVGGANLITTNSDLSTGLTNKITLVACTQPEQARRIYAANANFQLLLRGKEHITQIANLYNWSETYGEAFTVRIRDLNNSGIKTLYLSKSKVDNFNDLKYLKSTLVRLEMYGTEPYDIRSLFDEKWDNLSLLRLNSYITCDLSQFKIEKLPQLSVFDIPKNGKTYGTIGDITSPLTGLGMQDCSYEKTGYLGNIEDFVRAQRTAGRTEGRCSLGGYSGWVKSWRGNLVGGSAESISWTANTMTHTVDGGSSTQNI